MSFQIIGRNYEVVKSNLTTYDSRLTISTHDSRLTKIPLTAHRLLLTIHCALFILIYRYKRTDRVVLLSTFIPYLLTRWILPKRKLNQSGNST
jgi:hypothetical protein